MKRLVSRPNIVFTGVLAASKYNRDVAGGDQRQRHMDGFYAWKTRSSTKPDGSPERVWISNWEERRRFMKEEKLVGIEDVGDKFTPSADGRWAGTSMPEPVD